MKWNFIEHLFREGITILKRSFVSDRKISGFETIVIPVERKKSGDFIIPVKKSGSKQ
jgi:hypothetical protein